MRASDRKDFQRLMTDAMAFYRQDVSAFALSVWWQACDRYDLEQVASALTAHAMDPERGQFAPKPADIVRALQGTQTDRSLIAWGKVLDAAQRVGAYQSVAFDDGAIHAAIEALGGWPMICRTSHDELPHLQRRFCEQYRSYAKRPDLRYPPLLPGVHQQANATTGRQIAPPVLVGNKQAAENTLRTGIEGPSTELHVIDALPRPRLLGDAA